MDYLKNMNRRVALLVVGIIFVFVVVAIAVISFVYGGGKFPEIKDVVSEAIGRTDFNVDDIVVDDGDWRLVRIKSTAGGDSGNPAFMVLTRDGDAWKVVFGPGTFFSVDDLLNVGTSDSIIKFFYGDQVLWAGFNGLWETYGSMFVINAQSLIQQYAQSESIQLEKVLVVSDSATYSAQDVRTLNAVTHISFKFMINDVTEVLTVSTIGTAQSTTGQILVGGEVVFEKEYN